MQSRPNHLLCGENFWFNLLDILYKLEGGNDRHFVVLSGEWRPDINIEFSSDYIRSEG